MMTNADRKAWQEYLDSRKRWVSEAPTSDPTESDAHREKRVAKLLDSFEAFCWYYFSKYMTDADTGKRIDFGWFHKKAAQNIIQDRDYFGVHQWPREHAKSVLHDIFIPLFLKARGELTGMVIVSNNKDKALGLLIDLQAELEANKRYVNDFGEQRTFGDWEEGNFSTQDGVGFWALGRGQSPRGIRKAEKRPNYGVVDDIDDAEIVKNEERVDQAVDWVLGDLYGCFAIKGSRFVIIGNRIHKKSILAKCAGNVEELDKVRDSVTMIEVFALENPRTHREDQSEKGVPAWKENYTRQQLQKKFDRMGYRRAQREFFHKHIVEGTIFKDEWIVFAKLPKAGACPFITTYLDPSYKDTKKNDYKAIVCVGRNGKYFDVYALWVRQTTRGAMVTAHYDMHETLKKDGYEQPVHYIEANFMQDVHLEEYVKESETRNYFLAIRPDKRKKPDKFDRIERLTTYFERGLIRFSETLKGTHDFQAFKDQLLGFPNAHDDAPDALEGAIYIVENAPRRAALPVSGGDRRDNRL